MRTALTVLIMTFSILRGAEAMASEAHQPLIVIATVKVAAGQEAAFKAAAVGILKSTRAETGNISYTFNQGVQDPTEFSTFEVWRSQADIDVHMKTVPMKTFFQTVGPLFAPGYPVLKTYQSFEN
jgi:quinol monooxygenase YgiN